MKAIADPSTRESKTKNIVAGWAVIVVMTWEIPIRKTCSTRERVRSIGKDGNNGSQGQTTRHEQVAGSTPRPECPLSRRVERIPARTQRAVGGGGRAPAAE